MKTQIKLCIYDIKQGFVHNGLRLLLPVLFGILGPLLFDRMYTMVYGSMDNSTILECAMYMFKGGKYLTPDQISDSYVLPAFWLGIQIVIGFLVGYYPVNDMHTYGQQVLIRSKKRTKWWISKCVWNVATVIYCYVVMYGVMAVVCKIIGVRFTLDYSQEVITQDVMEMYPCTGTIRQIVIFVFIMPVVVSIAASLFQMMLSFIASPMIGFIAVESMALLSTMIISPVLFFNFAQLARTCIVSPSDIKYSVGAFVCLGIAIVSTISGSIYFGQYNVLSKE